MNSLKVKIQIGLVFILFSAIACERTEPENSLVITTDDIAVFSEGIYVFRGTIVSIGNEEITDHGFCWSESGNPVIEGSSICLGSRSTTGIFSSTIADFSANTTYYARAWAIAGSIPYYGEERSFTTPETYRLTVTDINHNIYSTIEIGDQIWMVENLEVTRYSDGSAIPLVEDRQAWYDFSLYSVAYCWWNNYPAIGTYYGALYTWPAAMHITAENDIEPGKVQGVCPTGWHLPSDSEWKQLEMFLGMSSTEANKDDWRGTDEGGKMKHIGSFYWENPNTGASNESGFSAIPGGWRDGAGYFKNLGTATRFWSSSTRGDYAWVRQLDYNSSKIYRDTKGLYEAHSVRCIKDE